MYQVTILQTYGRLYLLVSVQRGSGFAHRYTLTWHEFIENMRALSEDTTVIIK